MAVLVIMANRIMISLMSEKWIEVEGADLAQALEKACSELGLPRESLEYDFDLNHFRGGASTVRILAGSKDPQAARLSEDIDVRVKKLLEAQNLNAQVSVRVTIFAVQIELRASGPGVADHAFQAFAGTLQKDLAESIDGRVLRVSLRGFSTGERFESPRRERRGGPDDRGHRSHNDRPRYGERDRPGGRPRRSHPDDGGNRDEEIREKARSAIQKVIRGDGPVSVGDLNSYERRLVHLEVRESDGVASHSVGEGTHKDVLIDRDKPED